MGTNVNMFNYISSFKCTGSECKNTCCQYWDVKIDKDTYEKYNKVENKKLRDLIKNNMTKYVVDATFKDFAKVKLEKRTKRCPFLNTNNLCIIQKRLGEDYLSLVCQTFPKVYNKFPDMMELSLSLSCEEACRLALTSQDSMKVLNIDDNQTQKTLIAADISFPEKAAAIRYMRTYLLKVLGSTDYNIEQKLIIIGILIQSLKNQTETDRYGNEIMTQESFFGGIDEQSARLENRDFDLSSYLGHAEDCITDNINLLKEILTFKTNFYTEAYKKHQDVLLNFINHSEGSLNYHATSNCSYEDFLERNSYMLENYFKNYIYQFVFPFREAGESADIFEEYIILIFNYFIIKMHLISLLHNNASLEENDIVSLITCFCRNYENNFDYKNFVLNLCRENNINNLDKISKLIGKSLT